MPALPRGQSSNASAYLFGQRCAKALENANIWRINVSEHSERPSSKPNPALEPLEVLAGEWNTVGTHPHFPGAALRGRVTFTWIEGGAFLMMHSDVEQPGPPSGIAVFGRDDSAGTYSMLYFDERGVSRIYQMSLSGGVWKIWRNSPDFSQHFTGTFREDGNTIRGVWELSRNDSTWERDLQVTYTRVR